MTEVRAHPPPRMRLHGDSRAERGWHAGAPPACRGCTEEINKKFYPAVSKKNNLPRRKQKKNTVETGEGDVSALPSLFCTNGDSETPGGQ